MAANSNIGGTVKLRQAYAREGQPYCLLTVPRAVVEAWGVEPGELMSYFLSEDGALVFRPFRDVMKNERGFDESKLPKTGWKAPRPNSIYERAMLVETQMERAMKIGSGKATKEEREAFDVEVDRGVKRLERHAKALAHGRKTRPRRDRR